MFIFSKDIMTEQLRGNEIQPTYSLDWWKRRKDTAMHSNSLSTTLNSSPDEFFSSEKSHTASSWDMKIKNWWLLYTWTSSLDWVAMPARFSEWDNSITMIQHFDKEVYRDVIDDVKQSLEKFKRMYPQADKSQCAVILLHYISDSIAKKLRPGQNDEHLKTTLNAEQAKWNTELNPTFARENKLECCWVKMWIAYEACKEAWYLNTSYSISLDEKHAFFEIDTGEHQLRVDINSPKPITLEKWIFHAANISWAPEWYVEKSAAYAAWVL